MGIDGRGQSAFEYIMLVAIVMLVVVSGVGIMYQYSQKSNEDLKLSTIEKIGVDVLDSVEKVYYIGGDSWETLRLNIPAGVKGVMVYSVGDYHELIIEYDGYGGNSQAVFFSTINLTTPYPIGGGYYNLSSAFHPGLTSVKVTSKQGYVVIEEVA